jgi:hypothetical protein
MRGDYPSGDQLLASSFFLRRAFASQQCKGPQKEAWHGAVLKHLVQLSSEILDELHMISCIWMSYITHSLVDQDSATTIECLNAAIGFTTFVSNGHLKVD